MMEAVSGPVPGTQPGKAVASAFGSHACRRDATTRLRKGVLRTHARLGPDRGKASPAQKGEQAGSQQLHPACISSTEHVLGILVEGSALVSPGGSRNLVRAMKGALRDGGRTALFFSGIARHEGAGPFR